MRSRAIHAAAENRPRACAAALLLFTAAVLPHAARAVDQATWPLAVADFDYHDTSGEVADQTAQHAERMRTFDHLLREKLAAQGKYRLVGLHCEKSECSAASLGADGLIAAARKAGARLLVYGGVHKMSTLVQWGEIEIVDLERDELLLQRTFTFRGDTDLAFQQAAGFIGEVVEGVTPKP